MTCPFEWRHAEADVHTPHGMVAVLDSTTTVSRSDNATFSTASVDPDPSESMVRSSCATESTDVRVAVSVATTHSTSSKYGAKHDSQHARGCP